MQFKIGWRAFWGASEEMNFSTQDEAPIGYICAKLVTCHCSGDRNENWGQEHQQCTQGVSDLGAYTELGCHVPFPTHYYNVVVKSAFFRNTPPWFK